MSSKTIVGESGAGNQGRIPCQISVLLAGKYVGTAEPRLHTQILCHVPYLTMYFQGPGVLLIEVMHKKFELYVT